MFWKSDATLGGESRLSGRDRLRFEPVNPETIERLRRRAITNAMERQG
jgi:hypothetical protein